MTNMSEFLINLPYHKRWYLPDTRYVINSVIHGNDVVMSVIRMEDHRTFERATFKLDKEDKWKDLCYQFQKLAEKKYPKRLRHKNNERRDQTLANAERLRHKKGFYL